MSIEKRLEAIRRFYPDGEDTQKNFSIDDELQSGFISVKEEIYEIKSVRYYLDVKWNNFKERKSQYWVRELTLFSLKTGTTRCMEWEVDDELEISLTKKEIKLSDIQYRGSSLKRDGIDEIEDNEEGIVIFNGVKYRYSEDDTWAALYKKTKQDQDGIPVRVYEFEGEDNTYLSIESWEEEGDRPSREAFISEAIKVNDVKILQRQ